ncbi:hypothetical protein D3OALGA1CA_3254 [Olavius algarvensis associated proteobacterium Delta 3]|nr:hypothetical protein D3OALGB2SA_1849 [Olavius algarvensis associated proteobacterium Delta 3]CAB5131429.1 hypothetical protein D3OALGA1CA_3254 [Olavius algarvensis associated proteobacterium Delta 3]
MKCPECLTDNPETYKFCRECGSDLTLVCPGCGSHHAPDDKFCGECGHDVTRSTVSATPKSAFAGERRNVTVLFSDMSGYTFMTERLDPEDVKNLMQRILGAVTQTVTKYDGFVERVIGDAIMAIFGFPKSHEDDPIRALKAAMEIHTLVEDFSPRVEEKVGRPLSMHSGIATGLAVTGEVNLEYGTYGIVGDSVNLASRLQHLAEPGEILVSEQTHRQADGLFLFERLEPKKVKGKAKAVDIFRVIAPSPHRTKFDVMSERGLTPLVGRQQELQMMLGGFERIRDGRGQAFSIVSDAGMGKSRLLYEFRKLVAKEDVTFLAGKCLSYNRGMAYHPVIDILKSYFDIRDDDGESAVKEKLKNGLAPLTDDATAVVPYLLELLSVDDSGIEELAISPEGKKARINEVLKLIAIKGSEIRPLILAIEDLHWIDKSSEDALKELLGGIAGAMIFLLITYRHEYAPTWTARSYHHQVNLDRLGPRETDSVVFHLLDTDDIDEKLLRFIHEKTEGIPFFIEEFLKSFRDLNIIDKKKKYYFTSDLRDVMVPSTITDVIMARVDSLPSGARELLQTASLIERLFSHELICRVTGFPEQESISHLSALMKSELIYQRGLSPTCEYVFKHALTREVVVDSILTSKRKKLHEKIGSAIEELYKNNLSDKYRILAEHYIAGGNYQKGAEYARLTAKRAEKAAALNDAMVYSDKRIYALQRLPQTVTVQEKVVDARTTLGLYYLQYNFHVEAKAAVDSIFEMALKRKYSSRLSQIYSILGAYDYLVEGNLPKAFDNFKHALKIIDKEYNPTSAFFVNHFMGLAYSLNCEFDNALQCFQTALDINDMAKALWGVAAMKCMMSYFAYFVRGQIVQAHNASREALALAEQSGDIYSKALAHTCHGISYHGMGRVEEAKGHLKKGIAACEKIDLFFWNALAHSHLGELYFKLGEYNPSAMNYQRVISLLEDKRIIPYWVNLNRMWWARAKIMNNEKDIDLEPLIDCERDNLVAFCDGSMKRCLGEIYGIMDHRHPAQAELWLKKAIEADKKNGMLFNLGLDVAAYAGLLKRTGNSRKADKTYNEALEIFRKCGSDGIRLA